MVLSGEGSDEILGGMIVLLQGKPPLTDFCIGYLYFHAAPDPDSFHQECVRRVKNLHTADCLRANKYFLSFYFSDVPFLLIVQPRSTMAWGLEARVPFLDRAFLEVAMNADPKSKMFNKGAEQEVDEDGRAKMEKVQKSMPSSSAGI